MKAESPGQNAAYPPTRWTLVFRAQDLEKTQGRDALGEIYEKYREPLLAHLRWRFPYWQDRVEDWFQSFVEKKILEYKLLEHADRNRGRFRTFLLNALDNFVFEILEKANAAKRTPKGGFVFVDHPDYQEPADPKSLRSDPGDVEWAREVLAQAVGRTQKFYETKGDGKKWCVFYLSRLKPMFTGEKSPAYEDIAVECGMPVANVNAVIFNVVRKLKTELHSVVGEYAEGDEARLEEIQHLIDILGDADQGDDSAEKERKDPEDGNQDKKLTD